MIHTPLRATALRLPLLLLPGFASAASFIGLGDLPGGITDSVAFGVSADGTTVVGYGSDARGGGQAFRWTSSEGMVALGVGYGGVSSGGTGAFAVSADGSVVAGIDYYAHRAFRWTSSGGMELIGGSTALSPTDAFGISADGNSIAGVGNSSGTGFSFSQAYLWTSDGGVVGLGDRNLPNLAFGISADGSVVVGKGTAEKPEGAFRWTANGGLEWLGELPGAIGSQSLAYAASQDGTVIVGAATDAFGQWEAFRWTSAGGMAGLGNLQGSSGTQAYAVNYDGSVVVGMAYRPGLQSEEHEAIVWTEANGTQSIFDLLIANGATGLTGWTLTEAHGVSADGMWVAGEGINPLGQREAFVANIAAVPIPPALWLFGSALGLMGVMRRNVSS